MQEMPFKRVQIPGLDMVKICCGSVVPKKLFTHADFSVTVTFSLVSGKMHSSNAENEVSPLALTTTWRKYAGAWAIAYKTLSF